MSSQFVGVFSIGATLDRGLRLFKLSAAKVMPLILLPFVFGIGAALSFIQGLGKGDYHSSMPLIVTGVILNLIGCSWSWVVCIRYLHKLSVGESPTTSQMLRLAGPADLLLLITFFFWGIAGIIGLFLLIIPYLYIINIINVGLILAVVERQYFVNGMMRTFKLVKGRFWKTLVVNLLSGLIAYIPVMIGMILMVVIMVAVQAFRGSSGSESAMGPAFLAIFYAVYFGLISLSFPVIYSVQLIHYHSLRCEKESFDIESKIDELGNSPVDNPASQLN